MYIYMYIYIRVKRPARGLMQAANDPRRCVLAVCPCVSMCVCVC